MSQCCGDQRKLTIAVIGGGFGSYHVNGILSEPGNFELKTFCDLNPDVVERVARTWPAIGSTCSDYRQVIDDPGIDAVVVSLPHHLHSKVCTEVAACGKHILVDKPIARTLDEADEIIDAAARNNVTLMVAMNYRFGPEFRRMRELLASDAIGRPVCAVTRHIQNFNNPVGANWRSRESVGGGCVIGSGIHNIDLMRWFFGEPAEVFAYGADDPGRLEAEAAASISFRYDSGLVVNFSCNWCSHGAMQSYNWSEWDVSGTTGDIAIKDRRLLVGHDRGKSLDDIDINGIEVTETLWSHFANAVRTGSRPLIDGAEGRATLALVMNVYESMRTGRPVSCR